MLLNGTKLPCMEVTLLQLHVIILENLQTTSLLHRFAKFDKLHRNYPWIPSRKIAKMVLVGYRSTCRSRSKKKASKRYSENSLI